MRYFSLTALTRLIGGLALVACAVAVGMARLEPTPARYRLSGPPHYSVINGFVLDPALAEPGVLDRDTGSLGTFRTPAGDRFDFGACSPWEDEEGQSQLVGRWVHRSLDDPLRSEQFGLARFAVPSGRVLDKVPLDVVPAGHPCWSPEARARVVFAGTDGRLYHVDFDRDNGYADPEVRPVAWRAQEPGPRLTVRDPVWPRDPRLDGRLIVTLSYRARSTDSQLSPGRLWWVRLSHDASAVVDAGPLTDPDVVTDPPTGVAEERLPNLATAPDGRLNLAYLWQPGRNTLWELRTVPVDLDPATNVPVARVAETRVLSREHTSELPPFSADGRHVYGVLDDPDRRGHARVVRFEVSPPAETAQAAPAAPRG